MLDYRYRETIYSAYLRPTSGSDMQSLQVMQRRRFSYLKKLVHRYFPKNRSSKIIDLGCGSGTLISLAKQLGYTNIVGVDRSKEQVAAAHQLGIKEVQYGDLFDYIKALPDASQDMIVAFDVIEHLSKNELIAFVKEILRVLRPDGRWMLHTPNAESPFFGRVRYGDYTHELAFTQESIRQLLTILGFSRVAVYEDRPSVHGFASALRYVVWKFLRGILALYLMAETGERGGIFSQNLLAVAIK